MYSKKCERDKNGCQCGTSLYISIFKEVGDWKREVVERQNKWRGWIRNILKEGTGVLWAISIWKSRGEFLKMPWNKGKS